MLKPILIGLHGKARSGKDSIATELIKNGSCFFSVVSFVEPLKRIVMDLFSMDREQVYGDAKDEVDPRYKKSPRQILQEVGTAMRVIYKDIWVDYALRRSRELQMCGYSVIITDLRYKNEFEAIRNADGYIWKVVRLDENGNPVNLIEAKLQAHASEVDLDGLSDEEFDAVLSAKSGHLPRLYDQAHQALRLIYG